MNSVGPGGRTRRGCATNIDWAFAARKKVFQSRLDKRPATHVLRFLLRPNKLFRVRISAEQFAQSREWEGIKLLHSHNRQALLTRFLPRFNQIVMDLTAAKNDALNCARVLDLAIVNQRLEATAG